MHRRDIVLAVGWMVAMPLAMYAIAALDPMSWHARDAGYPSVALLVLFAAGVGVVGAGALWIARLLRYPGLFTAGVAGVVGGILGNVAGILTIHGLGGGNSAADIWSYPVIWYVGNPADASITLGAVLLLVWAARLVLSRVGGGAVVTVMVGVAVLPLLVAGTYTVARSAEIVGWQPSANAQLTRVVAHRAGLSESIGSRACAAQFSFVYHRPTSVLLSAADCPAILHYASRRPTRWATLIGSAPPGTLGAPPRASEHLAGRKPARGATGHLERSGSPLATGYSAGGGHSPAAHDQTTNYSSTITSGADATDAPGATAASASASASAASAGTHASSSGQVDQHSAPVRRGPPPAKRSSVRSAAPSVAVTIGPDGTVVATLSVPPPTRRSPARHELQLTPAQRRQLPCVRKALVTLAKTEPHFAVLAIDALCPAHGGGR